MARAARPRASRRRGRAPPRVPHDDPAHARTAGRSGDGNRSRNRPHPATASRPPRRGGGVRARLRRARRSARRRLRTGRRIGRLDARVLPRAPGGTREPGARAAHRTRRPSRRPDGPGRPAPRRCACPGSPSASRTGRAPAEPFVEIEPGLRLVASAPRARRRRRSPSTLSALIREAQAAHGLVVVDCGTSWVTARPVLDAATHILWTLTASRDAVARARLLLASDALPTPGRRARSPRRARRGPAPERERASTAPARRPALRAARARPLLRRRRARRPRQPVGRPRPHAHRHRTDPSEDR